MKQETTKPAWLKLSEKEVEDLVLTLAKQNITTEKIGLILRDQHGIPTTRVYGKKISQIIKQAGLEPKSAFYNAEKRVESLKKHIAKNKQDKKAGHAFINASATALKLKKYETSKKHHNN